MHAEAYYCLLSSMSSSLKNSHIFIVFWSSYCKGEASKILETRYSIKSMLNKIMTKNITKNTMDRVPSIILDRSSIINRCYECSFWIKANPLDVCHFLSICQELEKPAEHYYLSKHQIKKKVMNIYMANWNLTNEERD